jgi:hypothetical protein
LSKAQGLARRFKCVTSPEVVQATRLFRRLSEVSSHLLPVLALRDLQLLKTPEGTILAVKRWESLIISREEE